MPSSETDPKPEQKPVEKDVQSTKEDNKHVDRDGGQRQPNEHSDKK